MSYEFIARMVRSSMKIYLDNCCFNRPFDDQSQLRILLEAEAKLRIQENIRSGTFELVWSYVSPCVRIVFALFEK